MISGNPRQYLLLCGFVQNCTHSGCSAGMLDRCAAPLPEGKLAIFAHIRSRITILHVGVLDKYVLQLLEELRCLLDGYVDLDIVISGVGFVRRPLELNDTLLYPRTGLLCCIVQSVLGGSINLTGCRLSSMGLMPCIVVFDSMSLNQSRE